LLKLQLSHTKAYKMKKYVSEKSNKRLMVGTIVGETKKKAKESPKNAQPIGSKKKSEEINFSYGRKLLWYEAISPLSPLM